MLTIITMPFHNINYTNLSLAIIPYLHYGLLMDINTPNSKTKYARTLPPGRVPTFMMACRNMMHHVCIYGSEFFVVQKLYLASGSCHMGYDVIGSLVSDLTQPNLTSDRFCQIWPNIQSVAQWCHGPYGSSWCTIITAHITDAQPKAAQADVNNSICNPVGCAQGGISG